VAVSTKPVARALALLALTTSPVVGPRAAVAAPRPPASDAAPSGDFNGDGYHDLAVGVPYEDVNGKRDAGGVEVIYGAVHGMTGDAPIDDQFWAPMARSSVASRPKFATVSAEPNESPVSAPPPIPGEFW
jgi:hypothetical protein